LRDRIIARLSRFAWDELPGGQQLELLRVYTLTFLRLGPPDLATHSELIDRFSAVYPAAAREVNSELAQIMVYLQAPTAAAKTIALLERAPTQEEQIDLVKSLRHLREGWTPELRAKYFGWFHKASSYRGGASFSLFVTHIQEDAVALLSDSEKDRLGSLLTVKSAGADAASSVQTRPLVKEWQLDELLPLDHSQLFGRSFDRGREMFAAANCFGCHRFDNQGGAVGPDLTGLSGRFGPRDLLESIVDPDKVISDQYAGVTVVTEGGRIINGRIVNLNGESLMINTDMLDPNKQARVNRNQIAEMFPSKTSMMPRGLLNTLNRDEILDLMAYLYSGGNRNHAMFK
jgi:putative heme-binding domain-containing protein